MKNRTRSALVVACVYVFAFAALSPARVVSLDHGAQDPAISPDGKTIAVSVLGKIWLVPSAGGDAQQFSFGVGWDTNPAWSPDGTLLAFATHLPSGTDLVVRDLRAGTSSVLYHTESELGQIAFNNAATEVFVVVKHNQLDAHIYQLPSAGGQAKPLTEAQGWHEWSFALAPEGRTLYLESGRYGGANLYTFEVAKHTSMRLTHTTATQSSVNITPDGKNLVYVEAADGSESVVVRPLEGGAERRIFTSDYDDKQFALARDGTWGVLRAGRKLYRLDLASGKSTPIPFVAKFTLPDQSRGDLFIKNAKLPSGVGTIEIRDGRITSIRSGDSAAPPGVPLLDAQGRAVFPGLMDNHYHYWDAFDGARLLSKGITYIRDPGVDLAKGLDFKEAIALGIIPGPDIYTCGPLIDGVGSYHPMVAVEVESPEGARRVVRSLKSQGVDALKLYFLLGPTALRAAVQEAQQKHLPTTGHIGVRTGLGEAMDDGIRGLNHIRAWKDFLSPQQQPQGENESLDASRNMIARMQADWRDIDPQGPAAGALIAKMREHNIGFDPTLAIQKIPDELRKRLGLEDYSTASGSYDRMSQFVARAFHEGVTLLAGTDNGSLFDELEAYASAGIPSFDVVKTATSNGARWLGREHEFGSLEPGQKADLIVVDGDPLQDVKTLRKVAVVIKDGRVVARNEIKPEEKKGTQGD